MTAIVYTTVTVYLIFNFFMIFTYASTNINITTFKTFNSGSNLENEVINFEEKGIEIAF